MYRIVQMIATSIVMLTLTNHSGSAQPSNADEAKRGAAAFKYCQKHDSVGAMNCVLNMGPIEETYFDIGYTFAAWRSLIAARMNFDNRGDTDSYARQVTEKSEIHLAKRFLISAALMHVDLLTICSDINDQKLCSGTVVPYISSWLANQLPDRPIHPPNQSKLAQ